MNNNINDERYFIDQRAGCIAVRDRTLTNPDYEGLHEDTPGVVLYRHGYILKEACPCCNTILDKGWHLKQSDIEDIFNTYVQLNAEEKEIRRMLRI